MYATYKIPDANLEQLKAEISGLTALARKLNAEPVTLEVMEVVLTEASPGLFRNVHHVVITGQPPQLKGWAFRAKLDHGAESNVITSLWGSADLPVAYHTVEPKCEHCNLARNRVTTYVVENEAGTLRQVGSTCLKDFTGHANPHALAELYTMVQMFCDDAAEQVPDSEFDPIGGGRISYIQAETYMAYAARAVRVDGYTKRSDPLGATADLCLSAQFSRSPETPQPEEKDFEKARQVILWARNLGSEGLNGYLWNVFTVLADDYILIRHIGIAASAIVAYNRATERQLEGAASEFVGEVKKRLMFPHLEVTFVRAFDGNYGTTYLHKMVDPEGNQFTWWASIPEPFDVGDMLTGKGSVKDHEVYREVKQTVLTRCRLERISDAAAPPLC